MFELVVLEVSIALHAAQAAEGLAKRRETGKRCSAEALSTLGVQHGMADKMMYIYIYICKYVCTYIISSTKNMT
jgi:hypothetical protein